MSEAPFDPFGALEVLQRHGVDFIIIGGWGGRLLGSTLVTNDLDICYARDASNLDAMAEALLEMEASLRGAPEGLPFQLDSETLKAGDAFTFMTVYGALDILGTPAGTDGYADLLAGSEEVELNGKTYRVAGIDDLLRMKEAAGRPQDLYQAEILGALRDEIEKRRRR